MPEREARTVWFTRVDGQWVEGVASDQGEVRLFRELLPDAHGDQDGWNAARRRLNDGLERLRAEGLIGFTESYRVSELLPAGEGQDTPAPAREDAELAEVVRDGEALRELDAAPPPPAVEGDARERQWRVVPSFGRPRVVANERQAHALADHLGQGAVAQTRTVTPWAEPRS